MQEAKFKMFNHGTIYPDSNLFLHNGILMLSEKLLNPLLFFFCMKKMFLRKQFQFPMEDTFSV